MNSISKLKSEIVELAVSIFHYDEYGEIQIRRENMLPAILAIKFKKLLLQKFGCDASLIEGVDFLIETIRKSLFDRTSAHRAYLQIEQAILLS